jgi:hypothetical protein
MAGMFSPEAFRVLQQRAPVWAFGVSQAQPVFAEPGGQQQEVVLLLAVLFQFWALVWLWVKLGAPVPPAVPPLLFLILVWLELELHPGHQDPLQVLALLWLSVAQPSGMFQFHHLQLGFLVLQPAFR